MDFIIAAATDVGLQKNVNQDSLSAQILQGPQGPLAFAILCDGMGGLEEGERASATVRIAFERWVQERIPVLFYQEEAQDYQIRAEWEELIRSQNQKILAYGNYHGIALGTTATVLLITKQRYYIAHVGDSRAYRLDNQGLVQITEDQTIVAQEILAGRLTTEEAKRDPRRSVLLQCIGANERVQPSFYFGTPQAGETYLLCSDGFRHEITEEEIWSNLGPNQFSEAARLEEQLRQLIELNKMRQEDDNISALIVRVLA